MLSCGTVLSCFACDEYGALATETAAVSVQPISHFKHLLLYTETSRNGGSTGTTVFTLSPCPISTGQVALERCLIVLYFGVCVVYVGHLGR